MSNCYVLIRAYGMSELISMYTLRGNHLQIKFIVIDIGDYCEATLRQDLRETPRVDSSRRRSGSNYLAPPSVE